MKLFRLISLLRFSQIFDWIFIPQRESDAGIVTDEGMEIRRIDG